jgi:hypothetical protein
VRTTDELLRRKSSGSCLEIREYGRRDLSRWPCGTLYLQMLVLTWLTIGGRSVGIVRLRTQTFIVANLTTLFPSLYIASSGSDRDE